MLLSVLSQELSERKRLDFRLLAESDQSPQQSSSPVRCFDGDSVLSKLYLWQILPPQKGLKANMQRCSNISDWNKNQEYFGKSDLDLLEEKLAERLNSICYFSNPPFLWMQTIRLAALNVHIAQVIGEGYVGLRQFYHFVVNNSFFYKAWKIINWIKTQYCFNTALVFWTTDLNVRSSCFIATDLLDQLM